MDGTRTARRGDADRCAELCGRALELVQDQRGGSLLARREVGLVAKALLRPGGLDRLMADGRRRVLVSVADDAVVGMAVGHLDAVGEASIGIVDALFVDPAFRRRGAGRALLDELVRWFGAGGCRGVDVGALPGDRATKSMLESAGFKARLLTMHRTLS